MHVPMEIPVGDGRPAATRHPAPQEHSPAGRESRPVARPADGDGDDVICSTEGPATQDPIDGAELPVPRLIVWFDDSASDNRPLRVLDRTFRATIDHGVSTGVAVSGDHWAGWHLADPEAIAGLAKVARTVAPPHWTILEEHGRAQ